MVTSADTIVWYEYDVMFDLNKKLGVDFFHVTIKFKWYVQTQDVSIKGSTHHCGIAGHGYSLQPTFCSGRQSVVL